MILIGQTKQMDLYLKACDLIYTKPGGLTSTEAAASRTLIVHTTPIPGCETANGVFLSGEGCPSHRGHWKNRSEKDGNFWKRKRNKEK